MAVSHARRRFGGRRAAGAAGRAPRCCARTASARATTERQRPRATIVETIETRFMTSSFDGRATRGLRPLLGAEHAVRLPVSRGELLQHPDVLRRVSRAEASDRHHRSRRQLARLVAVANHAARRAGFERPPGHLAVGFLHIEKNHECGFVSRT